jgi:hypothetical protein
MVSCHGHHVPLRFILQGPTSPLPKGEQAPCPPLARALPTQCARLEPCSVPVNCSQVPPGPAVVLTPIPLAQRFLAAPRTAQHGDQMEQE